jgi:glycosyltransferase involved in cell wall biosynthesis
MIKIGFDAKRAFHNRSGLGNYSRDHLRLVQERIPDLEMHLYDPLPQKRKFGLSDIRAELHAPEGGYRIFPSAWRSLYLTKDLVKHGIQVYHGLSSEIPADMKASGIPSVVTVHDLIFERYPEWYNRTDRYIYKKKFRHATEQADLIVAISDQTRNDLMEFYGIPENRIRVIHQSCHRAFQQSMTEEELQQITEKWGLPDEFVLFVGTMESRKNVKNLVRAMETLDFPLVLVGGQKKKYTAELRDEIEARKMGHRVYFHQNVPTTDLAGFYRLAKLFVYPSIFEGFGIPIIEALYSGTPVVSSIGSCFSEAGGPESIYVDPKNIEELNNAIKLVLNDSEKGEFMRTAGMKYAQRFNWANVALNWSDTYITLATVKAGN